jgi:prepilin-type N-terminal cleavage/methylation domain-containing protein
MEGRMSRSEFTLVELLVVILIIGILASILLPVLIHVVNVARDAGQQATMNSLVEAIVNYEHTTMKLPPGDGKGSRGLVKTLREPGAKKMPYLQIHDDLLTAEGDLINIVHKDADPPINVVHYRNNGGRKPGPDGDGRPGVSKTREFDLWCAGLDYDPKRPDSAFSILRP